MQYNRSSHSVYYLRYHVVWVCKYRRKVLKPDVVAYLKKTLPILLRSLPGVSLEEIGFDRDHLHMVLNIPPKYAVADVMGNLKSRSASRLRKKFVWLDDVYWDERVNVFWSTGYFVSSIGIDEEITKKYVKHQGRRDSGQERLRM